jgi:ABC-type sugar transport system substrate-binding protein
MVQALNLALGRKPNLRSFITLRTPKRLKQLPRLQPVTLRRVIVAILLMLVLTAAAVALITPQLRPVDMPVQIVAGAHGTLADVTPSNDEIAAARERLGAEGFIAFLACTLDNVTQATRAREMGDMAAAFGLAYRVYNANNDAYTQVTQFEQARLDGARAFILCPLDPSLLMDSIDSLQAANIPLAYVTLLNHPYGVKLDSNSYDTGLVVGRLAGQIARDSFTDPARVVVFANPGIPAADSRDDGMEAGFREIVPNGTFLGRYPGSTEEQGYAAVQSLIESGAEFNVILALNDVSAYGAIQALQEAGFDPNSVIIVSANGESYAQELIRDGEFLRGTVAINREEGSQIAVDAIAKMLAGSEVPEIVSYPPGDILTREVLQARDG